MLLRTLFGLGHAIDPALAWLEIRDALNAPEPGSPAASGWIPPARLFLTVAEAARPRDAVSNQALWSVIRADEPASAVTQLANFLRLPDLVQEIVAGLTPSTGRRAVVIANTDRVRSYYPKTVDGVRQVVGTIVQTGVSPIFGSVGEPGAGRMAFDYVLEVRASSLSEAGAASLRCERAPSSGAFETGKEYSTSSIPALARALAGTPP